MLSVCSKIYYQTPELSKNIKLELKHTTAKLSYFYPAAKQPTQLTSTNFLIKTGSFYPIKFDHYDVAEAIDLVTKKTPWRTILISRVLYPNAEVQVVAGENVKLAVLVNRARNGAKLPSSCL